MKEKDGNGKDGVRRGEEEGKEGQVRAGEGRFMQEHQSSSKGSRVAPSPSSDSLLGAGRTSTGLAPWHAG